MFINTWIHGRFWSFHEICCCCCCLKNVKKTPPALPLPFFSSRPLEQSSSQPPPYLTLSVIPPRWTVWSEHWWMWEPALSEWRLVWGWQSLLHLPLSWGRARWTSLGRGSLPCETLQLCGPWMPEWGHLPSVAGGWRTRSLMLVPSWLLWRALLHKNNILLLHSWIHSPPGCSRGKDPEGGWAPRSLWFWGTATLSDNYTQYVALLSRGCGQSPPPGDCEQWSSCKSLFWGVWNGCNISWFG